jgi:hypothetical protein
MFWFERQKKIRERREGVEERKREAEREREKEVLLLNNARSDQVAVNLKQL